MSKRTEPIDTTPWDAAVAVSKKVQQKRLGRHGLALACDGAIRCTACGEAVVAIPRNRSISIGASMSAIAERHRDECRG
jgi:hypothetical protein